MSLDTVNIAMRGYKSPVSSLAIAMWGYVSLVQAPQSASVVRLDNVAVAVATEYPRGVDHDILVGVAADGSRIVATWVGEPGVVDAMVAVAGQESSLAIEAVQGASASVSAVAGAGVHLDTAHDARVGGVVLVDVAVVTATLTDARIEQVETVGSVSA